MNYFQIIDAKNEIINMLGNNVNNERVLKEVSLYSPRMLKQILLAKYISNILKANDCLYLLRGNENNSFINYLLGITNVNPIEYNLPPEMHTIGTLEFECPSEDIKKLIIKELKKITPIYNVKNMDNGKLIELNFKFIIPLIDDLNIPDYSKLRDISEEYYLIFNLNVNEVLGKIDYFKNEYGLPKYNVCEDNDINYEIFKSKKIAGLFRSSSINLNFEKLLDRCKEENWNFNTYTYISGALWMDKAYKLKDEINDNLIKKYPTTKDTLFNLLVEIGLSVDESKLVANEISKKKLFNNNKDLKEKIPQYLLNYLGDYSYFVSLGHVIAFAKMDYLIMYYKLNAPDFYNVMIGEYINDLNLINVFEIKKYCYIYENHKQNAIEDLDTYYYSKLFLEYKNCVEYKMMKIHRYFKKHIK